MSVDQLGEYGITFQLKTISLLLLDESFFTQIYDALKDEYFESDSNRWIVKTLKDYYSKYNTQITLESLSIIVKEINDELLRTTVLDRIREALKYSECSDVNFIKEKFIHFCKKQTMKNGILEVVDLLNYDKLDEVLPAFEKACNITTVKKTGYNFKNDVIQRYETNARSTISTGFTVIDEIMDGGLAPGELGVFVGGPGSGKSWLLVNLGLYAATKGYTVLHYSLELNESYTAMRYDSRLTGITSQNIKYHIDELKDKIETVKGNIYIEQHPQYVTNMTNIKASINKYKLLGIKPDLILIDYADIMGSSTFSTRKGNTYLEVGSVYEEIRGMSMELKIPIWTASQANRSSAEEDIIQGQDITDSFKKIMTADFVISVSRKVEDKIRNTARFFVIKNRFGPDGITFPADMNVSTGYTEIHSNATETGITMTKNMRQNGKEIIKNELAIRYKEFEISEKDKNKSFKKFDN